MPENTEPNPAQGTVGYETRDVNARGVLYFVIGIFLLLAFTLVSMRWLFGYFYTTQPLGPAASPFADSRTLPPEPRLQVHPQADLDRVREGQEELLHSYGWVDRADGKVRIPIDRAMDLLLEHPLPARRNPPAQPAAAGAEKEQGK